MRVAWLIARKDLVQRLRDRSALLLTIVAPLTLAFAFSMLLGSSATFHVSYAVVDLDGGGLARTLGEDVIGRLEADGLADVTELPTEAAAREAVEGGMDAAFVIPQGFTAAIEAGRPTTLAIIGRPDSALAVEIARAVADRFGADVVKVQLTVATAGGRMNPPPDAATQARLAAAAIAATPPVRLVDDPASLRALDMPSFFSASMAIMFLFFAAGFGMVSLFEERRNGTMARILAGPVRPWWILAGKMTGGFAISVIAMTILVVATTLLVGADWGPPAGVGLLILGGITASLGISALVTSFANSAEAAGAANAAVAITLSILGGSFMPMSQAPEVMATFALVTPHGWFLRGLGDLAVDGAPLTDILPALGVLVLIGIVTGALGMLRARRLVTAR